MDFFNDGFESDFFGGLGLFGKPMHLVFRTNGIKDMYPSVWSKTDEGYKCTVKTLGVNENDISVTVEDYGIKVIGKSKIDDEEYSTEMELPIAEDVMSDLKEIKYSSKNGLTFINLICEHKRKNILINGK